MALDIFRIADSQELTDTLLLEYIQKNDAVSNKRYKKLWGAYTNNYAIYRRAKRPDWKPDARLSVNFARYIVETFEGFFAGNPVRVFSDDETVQDFVTEFNALNDASDIFSELSTIVSIFGRGYLLSYVDENGDVCSAYLDPMESFAIYSDSIKPKMQYFVRTYIDASKQKIRRGSISDDLYVRYFHINGGSIVWDSDYIYHGFGSVPVVEFVQNRARRGIFEDVLPLIDAFNEALSSKDDNISYFSDSYLKIIGAKLDEESLRFLRTNRTINIPHGDGVDIGFLEKPSADETEEHFLDRVQKMIFEISMVCNVNDDNFATSSGIALKYKMLSMINLAGTKWRKFEHSLYEYYRIVFANPVNDMDIYDASTLSFVHTLNYPANISDEVDTASKLAGIVSQRTQLSVLSIVDDVDSEIERINDDKKSELDYVTDYETNRVTDDVSTDTE